ncbi:MAG: aspartate aminotransferase family protein [Gammaproteobacteria bacterium]|nr:MAG: aspartate aminotransferase family protein [Gammaproteobacteria bacterium]
MNDHLMNTYRRLPVAFRRGEGAWLEAADGRRYLDALSGIAVCSLGHAHPAVREAVCRQAGEVVHVSNLYRIPQQEELGTSLCAASGMERVFFANSGAEANEAAIKLARLYGHNQGIEEPAIVVMEGSFHGRTMATLTATGNRKVRAGFEPLLRGFVRAPFGDLEAVRTIAANNRNVVAILVEPVQGEGGVRVPEPAYLNGLREICDDQGWLLMLDEIQTGMGRTGQMFAFQHHEDLQPDVMTLAKALGNGVPIGACLARGLAAEVLMPGSHGSTFGGNPLACAAGLAVLQTLQQEQLVQRAAELGARMLDGFREALDDVEGVRDIRGLGLMLGIELERPCGELVARALEEGLLINVTADSVVRLLPPLVISDEEAEQIVGKTSALIRAFLAEEDAS